MIIQYNNDNTITKRIPGFGKLTYGERLNRLSIPNLELRRLRTDLIWCYKILFGCINTIASDLLVSGPHT